METWIYMLITDLLIPVIMVGFGKYFSKTAPKNINMLFGYRTSMSMKNQDTWAFAHHYCGRIWFVGGSFLLAASLLVMLSVITSTENVIGAVGSMLCVAQMIALIVSIILTEKALKKTFDKNGIRR
ncbi:MAG: SdpI family protein [Christensenellaceae bacterium]|nr:SdpI family protein [Christensenellaceae bacterium]